MSDPSVPTRCLLNKNTVRLIVAALRFDPLRPLSVTEQGALLFWRMAEQRGLRIFIPDTSAQVLRRMTTYAEVNVLLSAAHVMEPGRYARRWARRLRETTGLTREDAMILALGTFSTDEAGSILGAPLVVTYDRSMINGYLNHLPALKRRFRAMTVQLQAPFHQATLPRLATPDEMLLEWAG